MGASESKPSAGFKIISVTESSPARHAGLQPSSDVIISINGNHLTSEGTALIDILKGNVGKDCTLLVFNVNNLNTREVIVVPAAGDDPLGAVVKFTQLEEESCNDHGHSHSHGSHGHSHSHGACDDDHGHSH